MSAEELKDVYIHPGLPRKCRSGALGNCALNSCPGLGSATVVEAIATQGRIVLSGVSGEYCLTHQTATRDGRVYNRAEPVDWPKVMADVQANGAGLWELDPSAVNMAAYDHIQALRAKEGMPGH